MRLLLDEHYSPEIAEQLREHGHDVISVKERADLIGVQDEPLFGSMAAEGRALLTENWADFMEPVNQAGASGQSHAGVIFPSRQRMPRSRDTIGLYVRVLDEFLNDNRDDHAMQDRVEWLPT